jgi:hypothetical protein
MAVQRADADPGGARDVGHLHPTALTSEDLAGRGEDPLTVAPGVRT